MDFSKFSDDSFDIKDWLNNSLKGTNPVALENHVSSLIMKLQLFIQEVNKSLEETSQVALNNIPRVLREIENISSEANHLKKQMDAVKDDIKKVEEGTSNSMKSLMAIDQIKERMQNAACALKEADNWSKSSSEVSEAISLGDLDQVAEKLIIMQKSLQVLSDAPDYHERFKILETYKNKLEAQLSPKLVQTFNNHNVDDAKYYIAIFDQLNRLSHLQTYYNNSHKSSIAKNWSSIKEGKSISMWLPQFYDNLLSLWHDEVSWCVEVFSQPVMVLSSLLTQSVASLQPSLGKCIQESVDESNSQLQLLLELKSSTSNFEDSLKGSVHAFQGICDCESIQTILDLMKAPFSEYLLQYSTLQQDALMKCIDELKFSSFRRSANHLDNAETADISDASESILDSISIAFRAANEATDACWVFTQGFGICGLHEALQVFFSTYFGQIDSTISSFRQQLLTSGSYAEINWTNFQHAFKIIESCGTLITKLDEFREHLCNEIRLKFVNLKDNQGSNYLLNSRLAEWQFTLELYDQVQTNGKAAVLLAAKDLMLQLNKIAHTFAFDLIFAQFKHLLINIPALQVWQTEEGESVGGELPQFSLSPQGYITHIGDALLTLPQQLEPYFIEDNQSLMISLKLGKLPFHSTEGAHLDHQWLECFARGSSVTYYEAILKIKQLTNYSQRQLLTDLDYYCNILAALEIDVNPDLLSVQKLLQATPEEFPIVSENMDKHLVACISNLRHLVK